jgi:uncharacterized protein (TIGR02145 family)
MRALYGLTFFLILWCSAALSQVGINTDGSQPSSSALLDVNSTSKGFLLPRMTYDERKMISNPAEGLMVYCTDCGLNSSPVLSIFITGVWKILNDCAAPDSSNSGVHQPFGQRIIWKWHPVANAAGYKWSTTNVYSTSIDVGTDTSKLETGLNFGTTYSRYVWTYGSCGISVVSQLTQTTNDYWTCGEPFTDTRDATEYQTVVISGEYGSQCWMAENLNIGTMIDVSLEQISNGSIEIIEKYCYDNFDSLCGVYGGLYQWNEMMQYNPGEGIQGICPVGWHIPTHWEWCVLPVNVGYCTDCNLIGNTGCGAGLVLKSAPGLGVGWNGTNSSGFTALPAGDRTYLGWFYGLYMLAGFWSSSSYNSSEAWSMGLSSYDHGVSFYNSQKNMGYSVRCIKN